MDVQQLKPRQFWIRDAHGDVFGPLTRASIELFLENGLFKGALMASRDGVNFDAPGHLPELRDAFPQALSRRLGELPQETAAAMFMRATGSAR